jgi:putative endonuclease
MFYVYLIESQGKFYVGFTSDLEKRLQEHNRGKSFYTKSNSNWVIIFYEAFIDKADAKRREQYFKTTPGRKALKMMLRRYRLAHSTSGKAEDKK